MSGRIKSSAALPLAAFAVAGSESNQAIGGIATIVFAVVFLGWIVFTLALDAWRTRRERETVEDRHTIMVPGLGTTMADGGEPTDEKEESHER